MDICYIYDLICGWCEVLFFTKILFKNQLDVLFQLVRDDYELSEIFDLTM